MPMPLFSAGVRIDVSRRQARESSYSFLDRSARAEIARVRQHLSDAVDRFPASGRDDIVARLQSGDEVAFRSACFEVLIHDALERLGFSLEPHPDPGNGSAKRPDFLVTDPEGVEFYLEAVLASERNGRNPGAEARKLTALGTADQHPHHAFMLDVQSEGDPTTQPPGKKLAAAAHAWLDTLNADELRASLPVVGLDGMPTNSWTHEGWTVSMRAIPLALEQRGSRKQLIGAFGDGVRWVNTWEPLRNAVTLKAGRYGDLDKPLVVAINTDSFHLDRIDEVQALYGQEEWVEVIGNPTRSGMRRRENGAWRGPYGPQCRRASAVWFFNDLTPYTLATRRATVFLNPWAHHAAPASLRQFPTVELVDDRLRDTPGMSLRDVFQLTEAWPE